MRGRGIADWLGKANNFLQKSRLVSSVANGLAAAGVPFAGSIGSIAGSLGYGRHRRRHGSGVRLAGGMHRLRY